MKRVLYILLLASCLTSCSVKIPYLRSVEFVDYASLSQEYGLFLSESNSVSFDYETIGSVSVTEKSGHKMGTYSKKYNDDIYDTSGNKKIKMGDYIPATSGSALRLACEQAVLRGGNGIVNIKIVYIPATKTSMPGYHVSGMIIKK